MNSTSVLEDVSDATNRVYLPGAISHISVEIARQGGYELGFSAYSRTADVQLDPLGEEERSVNDPLMVLHAHGAVRLMSPGLKRENGEQAAAFAEQNFGPKLPGTAPIVGETYQ